MATVVAVSDERHTWACHCCSVVRGISKRRSRITTLDFRRADFVLFRDQLGRIPWEIALEGKSAQESRLIFKDKLLRAQEWSTCNVQEAEEVWQKASMDEQGAPDCAQTQKGGTQEVEAEACYLGGV